MVKVEELSIRAGDFRLDGISFEIPKGEYGVLMGRTGCGKTTILEAICGIKHVVDGTINLMGVNVTHLSPGARGIGFVPQDGSLFSTKTVRKHLAFGPRLRGWDRDKIDEQVKTLAEKLGLTKLLDRKPHGLSGGERQRVSLGRALAIQPGVLCLDEPLSALDEATHDEMIALIKQVTDDFGITTLHITHSRREAELVADRVFRLEDGVLWMEED